MVKVSSEPVKLRNKKTFIWHEMPEKQRASIVGNYCVYDGKRKNFPYRVGMIRLKLFEGCNFPL